VTRQQLEPASRAAPSPACSVPPRVAPTANRCWCLPTAKTNMLIHATKISACVITRRFFRAILRSESAFSREKNLLKASTGKHKDYYSGEKTSACVSREKSQARFKGSKYLLRGKRISKCFKRPESTQKDVPPPPRTGRAEILRNCVCSFLQHEPLSVEENKLAASDVARFYSGHPRYLLRPETLSLHAKGKKTWTWEVRA